MANHLIAWRRRTNAAEGLDVYDPSTMEEGTLISAMGFAIRRRWFFGLLTYKFAPRLGAHIVLSRSGWRTTNPKVHVGIHSRQGMAGVWTYDDTDAGNAQAELGGNSLARISGLPIVDERADKDLRKHWNTEEWALVGQGRPDEARALYLKRIEDHD